MVEIIALRSFHWQGQLVPVGSRMEVSDFQSRELAGTGKAMAAPSAPVKPVAKAAGKAKAA